MRSNGEQMETSLLSPASEVFTWQNISISNINNTFVFHHRIRNSKRNINLELWDLRECCWCKYKRVLGRVFKCCTWSDGSGVSVQASPPPVCSDAGVSFINGLQHNSSFRPRSQCPNFLSFLSVSLLQSRSGCSGPLFASSVFSSSCPCWVSSGRSARRRHRWERQLCSCLSTSVQETLSLSVCLTLSLSVTLPNRAVSLTALSLSLSLAQVPRIAAGPAQDRNRPGQTRGVEQRPDAQNSNTKTQLSAFISSLRTLFRLSFISAWVSRMKKRPARVSPQNQKKELGN